mgnify:CR=1 FL=1
MRLARPFFCYDGWIESQRARFSLCLFVTWTCVLPVQTKKRELRGEEEELEFELIRVLIPSLIHDLLKMSSL